MLVIGCCYATKQNNNIAVLCNNQSEALFKKNNNHNRSIRFIEIFYIWYFGTVNTYMTQKIHVLLPIISYHYVKLTEKNLHIVGQEKHCESPR